MIARCEILLAAFVASVDRAVHESERIVLVAYMDSAMIDVDYFDYGASEIVDEIVHLTHECREIVVMEVLDDDDRDGVKCGSESLDVRSGFSVEKLRSIGAVEREAGEECQFAVFALIMEVEFWIPLKQSPLVASIKLL